jgi:hypothetical protein
VNRASLADVGGSWVDMVANVSELSGRVILISLQRTVTTGSSEKNLWKKLSVNQST